jgi:hypothetical protein
MMAIRAEPRAEREPSGASRWATGVSAELALLVCAVMSVSYQGFHFGVVNNHLQVPLLLKAQDPTLFPNDPFADTLRNYFSIVWWLLARLPDVGDWAPLFLVLQIFARYLLLSAILAWMRLGGHDARLALLVTATISVAHTLFAVSPVGRHGLLQDYFEHTVIATVLLLRALAAIAASRGALAFGLMGLAFDVNAFVGAWGAAMLAIHSLTVMSRSYLTCLVRWSAVFVVAASPALLWLASMFLGSTADSTFPGDYRAYLREYYPKHFMLTASRDWELAWLGATILLGVLALAIARALRSTLAVFYAAAVGLFLAGTLLPSLTAQPMILNLHMLRVDGIIVFLAVLSLGWAVVRVLEDPSADPIAKSAVVLALAGLVAGNWFGAVAMAAVALSRGRSGTARWRWVPACAIAITGALALLAAGRVPEDSLPHASQLVAFIASLAAYAAFAPTMGAGALALVIASTITRQEKLLVLALAALALQVMPVGRRRRWIDLASHLLTLLVAGLAFARAEELLGRALLGASILVVTLEAWRGLRAAGLFGTLPIRRIALTGLAVFVATRFGEQARTASLFRIERATRPEWLQVQEWARAHTPHDAVFLVPARETGFEVFARRSVWVDWKHGAASMWMPSFYSTWRARTRAQAEATDPAAFADSTGACFAVVPRTEGSSVFRRVDLTSTTFPIVFQNQRYIVLVLCRQHESGALR